MVCVLKLCEKGNGAKNHVQRDATELMWLRNSAHTPPLDSVHDAFRYYSL